MTPQLILGMAMWGWTIPKENCFRLLDTFYKAGHRALDGATNYPINKIPDDFRKSESILLEWINTNGISDLEIMMKVGSINNLRSPDHNLNKSFLLLNLDDYLHRFGSNLHTFMIHWDNRNSEAEIRQSLEAFETARDNGLELGLSGIRHPELYAALNEVFRFDFSIQIKHNLLYSDYPRYAAFHGKAGFITYGINGGGLKLRSKEYKTGSTLKVRGGQPEVLQPMQKALEELLNQYQNSTKTPVQNFNHCGMTFAYHSPDVKGILIGPSNVEQLKDSLDFYHKLQNRAYLPVFEQLKQISTRNA